MSGIPKQLQRLFDERGYAMLGDFAAATGIAYPNVLRRAQQGEIPAVDVSPPSSSRACWRLFEGPTLAWFTAVQKQNAKAVKETVIPDDGSLYDDEGNWLGPKGT